MLSARRICQAGLKAKFNHNYMYFKQGKKKVIEATMKEGLYIVTHVAKGFEETGFISTDLDMRDTEENAPLTLQKQRHVKTELTKDQKEI